jgi:hypothetical protein
LTSIVDTRRLNADPSQEEVAMKRALLAAALAVFALAPGVGAACEYNDASAASATPTDQLGMAPAPAATMVPAPTAAKARATNAAKPVAAKAKARVPDQKLAAGPNN